MKSPGKLQTLHRLIQVGLTNRGAMASQTKMDIALLEASPPQNSFLYWCSFVIKPCLTQCHLARARGDNKGLLVTGSCPLSVTSSRYPGVETTN